MDDSLDILSAELLGSSYLPSQSPWGAVIFRSFDQYQFHLSLHLVWEDAATVHVLSSLLSGGRGACGRVFAG
jgi:hypothetical protein